MNALMHFFLQNKHLPTHQRRDMMLTVIEMLKPRKVLN